MPPKRNRPLRDQQGLAMILVLCLGALFVALAAALVYAASLMMANADRQLPEQDVYELAVSFSDVLEQELLHYTGAKEKDGVMTEENDQSIGYFINHIYVKKGSIDNPYGDDTDHTFTLQAPEGIDEMTVTLNKHPSDDVDGRDACRKIAILSSLVCGHQIYPQNIPTRGIRAITTADVEAAEKLGCVIKLIAWMKRGKDGSVAAGVEPCLVPKANQLASVDDVFNAVLVKGDMLGDVVFYGKGAGKLPTASAVVADVVDALKHGSKVHDSLFWQPAEPVDGMLTDPTPAAYYVRVAGIAPAVVEAIYGYGKVVDERYDGCSYFVERADEKALAEAARKVEAVGGSVKLVLKRLPEEA